MKRFIPVARRIVAVAVTFAMVVLAVIAGTVLWNRYMLSPWTRDGRVRAETVSIAPEVSGTVIKVRVTDNQFVHKGDVLFEVDPERFTIALTQAQTVAESRRQQMQLANANAQRRGQLTSLSISSEEKLSYDSTAAVAKAQYGGAAADVALAKLNLARTIVRSPVNGYVANLNLRKGDYVKMGKKAVTMIDSDSFWIAGYFEETKLRAIHEGDKAVIVLMGYSDQPLSGHVVSFSRGISNANDKSDAQGLASVNPVFTWVRLAQRIPVHIHIDKVPPGIILAAGMTCSVTVEAGQAADVGRKSYFERLLARL